MFCSLRPRDRLQFHDHPGQSRHRAQLWREDLVGGGGGGGGGSVGGRGQGEGGLLVLRGSALGEDEVCLFSIKKFLKESEVLFLCIV